MILFHNGTIHTIDSTQPQAEALLVGDDGRILVVGRLSDVEAAAKSGTKRIDLAGRTLVPGFTEKTIPPAQFNELHKKMAPRGDQERWATIPWQSDLTVARQKAAREGKPLFMWIMDGHPLGCT